MVADHHLVFVYGLLKRGFSLHQHLGSSKFLGEAQTSPNYFLVDCQDYPGLRHVTDPGDGMCVFGEVFEVNAATLEELDLVEGVDEGLYCRERVQLQGEFSKQQVWAWFFVSHRFDSRLLQGQWD